MKRILLAALVCALGACGQSEQAAETTEAEAPSADLNIGPAGAAGISAPLQFTIEAVQNAAPLYDVAEAEGNITLSLDGAVVFTAKPGADGAHIGAIVTRSPRAQGRYWEVVGQTTLAQVAAAEQAYCVSEPVESDAHFICAAHADAPFVRVFQLPEWYRGDYRPFEAINPYSASDAILVEMRWRAPPL